MTTSERFFFVATIALACFALWRSAQGQFAAPDSEPEIITQNEFEKRQLQELISDYGLFTEPKVPNTSALVAADLKRGRQIYAVNCLHCHGSDGRGQTTTARLLNPPPTDLFTGPVRDIETVLRNGIPSTAMSSFEALSEQDFEDVRDYAAYIVERGTAWKSLIANGADE
ncbi:MAG: c-type cytochrome [Planctomycetota bacterium]|jgi:mono/diheme cytochrome c family protein|nr:c-type cytochrome [Planctomycetota bacterium]